jgi:hypothetical protein
MVYGIGTLFLELSSSAIIYPHDEFDISIVAFTAVESPGSASHDDGDDAAPTSVSHIVNNCNKNNHIR